MVAKLQIKFVIRKSFLEYWIFIFVFICLSQEKAVILQRD